MTERVTEIPGSLKEAFAARDANPDKVIIVVNAPNGSRVLVCNDESLTPDGEQKQTFGSEFRPG